MLVSNKKVTAKILLIFVVLINIFSINSLAVISQTKQFYVNDYANLIDSETEEYIINTNLNLYNQTGAQIVVVTVKNLEGKTIEEYATELFRKFGIGDSTKNNGVLMLLALEEREFRIEVGYGLEGALTDAKTGRIQDQYIIPYLSQSNWDAGIKNGYNAIIKVVAEEYNVKVNATEPIETTYSNTEDYTYIIILLIIIIVIFIATKNGVTISNGSGYYGEYDNIRNRRSYGGFNTSRNRSSGRSRTSFGGGGSSGGGGSTRKF